MHRLYHTQPRHTAQRSAVGVRLFLITVLLLFLLICISVYWFLGSASLPSAFGVIIYKNPVEIVFPRKLNGEGRKIIFPTNVTIPSVGGLGQYELDSLWKLSILEENSNIFVRSVAETLGVPISGYIGPVEGETLESISNPWQLVMKRLQGKLVTNLSIQEVFTIANAHIGEGERDNVIDISQRSITEPSLSPDERVIEIVDTNKIDYLLGIRMYNEPVRKEGLRVSVRNTTSIPLLGSRAARLLGNAGVNVVSVGNNQPTRLLCEIHTSKKFENGPTSLLATQMFGCVRQVRESLGEPVDMVIYLGDSYAAAILGALNK